MERHSHPQQTVNAEKKKPLCNSTLILHAFRSGKANVFHPTVETSPGVIYSLLDENVITLRMFLPLQQRFSGRARHRAKVMSSHADKMCNETV